jgi:hypothetical protein
VRRINLFLKGNLDLRDSLHSCREHGQIVWNGINEAIRARYTDVSVRVRHETWTRSDALLSAAGGVPAELSAYPFQYGAYPLALQLGTALFDGKSDAIVLSIQPDLATHLLHHRASGVLLYPGDLAALTDTQRCDLQESFEPVAPLDPTASMSNFARIIEICRAKSDAPILVYNVSSVVPGDMLHDYAGMENVLSTRIREFNLALIRLSQRTGISIVDVDTLVARHGADRVKLDALHLNATGCRLVAEEVVRILAELLCL